MSTPAKSRTDDQVREIPLECRNQPIMEEIFVHARGNRSYQLTQIHAIPEHRSEVMELVPSSRLVLLHQQGRAIGSSLPPRTPSPNVLNVHFGFPGKSDFICKADVVQVDPPSVQIVDQSSREVEAVLHVARKELLDRRRLERPVMKFLAGRKKCFLFESEGVVSGGLLTIVGCGVIQRLAKLI